MTWPGAAEGQLWVSIQAPVAGCISLHHSRLDLTRVSRDLHCVPEREDQLAGTFALLRSFRVVYTEVPMVSHVVLLPRLRRSIQ